MASSLRPGEITYYEELGVENTASADEIRDAFRSLARILHPDAQTDPQLKEMAERQMRKLNRIHSVLSDAARRTAYDRSLSAPRNLPVIVFSGSDGNLKKLLARGALVAGLILSTFLLIWFMLTSNNSEVRGQEPRIATNTKSTENNDGDPGDQVSRLREQLRVTETERDSALEQLSKLGAKPADSVIAAKRTTQPVQVAATALTELPKLAAAPIAAAPAVTVAQFSGVWVYTKGAASPGGKSEYPPDFIEVTLTEKNGSLHGQYHSRYQVLDHAISPDVDFVFNGTPNGSALNCSWQGPGGARGRMTLKLLPASVEIAWNATELGTQQWLVNGTATLVRK